MDEGALLVIAYVHREPGPHGVMGRAAADVLVPGFESGLGDVRVVQGVPDLFEDESRGGFEVQGGVLSSRLRGR